MYHLRLLIVLMLLVLVASGVESSLKHGFEARTCNLLEQKFAASNPWTTYPIVYEPINRGRLTVWTGISSLPTSEFKCYTLGGANNGSIVLDFANFAHKLDWTFYDMSKGFTHHGVSVIHCDDVKFKLAIKNKQSSSYLECNTVESVDFTEENETAPSIQTSCQDCGHALLALINNQIKELMNLKFKDQTRDNLYWHVTQLVSNQHFSTPTPL